MVQFNIENQYRIVLGVGEIQMLAARLSDTP